MPLLECPVCHQKPAYAGNTAYCPHCGWNRDSAISGMKMSLNAIPLALFMFGAMAAFMYWGMKFSRAPWLLLFMLFPVSFIPLNYFLLKRKMAKLRSMQVVAGTPPISPNFGATFDRATSPSSSPAATFAPSREDEALLRMPAPRRVRTSKRGRITLWVAALGLSLFIVPAAAGFYRQWVTYHSFSNSRGIGWAIAIECIVALAIFGIWRGQVRERELLERGEVVMGRVTRQWTDEGSSQIEYEFTDFVGSLHRASANDRTDKLVSGMPLVVFYDRDSPNRQVAYCSTLHEVILPPTASPVTEELLTKR
jgi:hypothetical protein